MHNWRPMMPYVPQVIRVCSATLSRTSTSLGLFQELAATAGTGLVDYTKVVRIICCLIKNDPTGNLPKPSEFYGPLTQYIQILLLFVIIVELFLAFFYFLIYLISKSRWKINGYYPFSAFSRFRFIEFKYNVS